MADNNLGFATNFVISGCSAAVSKTATAPLERIKLLLQCQGELIKQGRMAGPYKGARNCAGTIYKSEGLRSFWKGNLANCLRFFPKQVFNFAFKDTIQTMFKSTKNEGVTTKFAKNMASGGAAGALTLLLDYPVDYARTRLANNINSAGTGGTGGERQFRGLVDVFRQTLASDGVVGLYRGYVITCVGVVVYRGFYFGLYDTLRPIVLQGNTNSSSNMFMSFLLGYGVTITSIWVAYPFDTIRRRMMMTSCEPAKYRGSVDCVSQIVRAEGVMTLMKGAGVNVLTAVAGAVLLVCWDTLRS